MRLLYILSLLLICAPAFADPLPTGCYVTDNERFLYQEPPVCYESNGIPFTFFTPLNTSDTGLYNLYGDIVGGFIRQDYNSKVQIETCAGAFRYSHSLIKRMKKACGTRCKRIK